jgi:serpin B
MPMKAIMVPFTLLLAILWFAGCAPPATQPPATAPAPTPGGVAQSTKPRLLSPSVAAEQLGTVAGGNNAFALDLYRAIRGGQGNLFYSPYSLSLALAMTYAGARGDTEQQMAGALHFTLPQAQLHPAFDALDLRLNTTGQPNADFKLSLANSLWGQAGFAFRPEFLDTLAENYGAGLRLADFTDAARREQARQTINRWVSDQTQGKIPELLAQGFLSDMTRLVLVNAIYFKADWETPFTRGTHSADFTRLDNTTVSVPMMSRRTATPYVKTGDYEAAEIAYQGGRMRMLVLLPAPGQFAAFEGSLTAERVDAAVKALKPDEVILTMPKFRYDASLDLNQTLSGLGMRDAFDPQRADLSGMTGQKNLFIAHVVHKAFVAVDELGTEAAAATGVGVEATAMPTALTLNRPFVFVIRDGETGAILFVGRVLDPKA